MKFRFNIPNKMFIGIYLFFLIGLPLSIFVIVDNDFVINRENVILILAIPFLILIFLLAHYLKFTSVHIFKDKISFYLFSKYKFRDIYFRDISGISDSKIYSKKGNYNIIPINDKENFKNIIKSKINIKDLSKKEYDKVNKQTKHIYIFMHIVYIIFPLYGLVKKINLFPELDPDFKYHTIAYTILLLVMVYYFWKTIKAIRNDKSSP